MGCNCGKGLPKARAPRRTVAYAPPAPEAVTRYRNDAVLAVTSRNPRLSIEPGETVELSNVEINCYVVKMAIRNGELVPAPEEVVEEPPAKKTPVKKIAA